MNVYQQMDADEFFVLLVDQLEERVKALRKRIEKTVLAAFPGDGAAARGVAERRDAAQRLLSASGEEGKAEMLAELRKASRRKYVAEREAKKLTEAADDLKDEEYLFGDASLTKREREEIALKKKLHSLASERVNLSDHVDRYQMPTAFDADGAQIGEALRASGGVESLCSLLEEPNEAMQEQALLILANLCSNSVDPNATLTKRELWRCGGGR